MACGLAAAAAGLVAAASGAPERTLAGVVTTAGQGLPASQVVLYDAGRGAPARLGAAWTAADGSFRIVYRRPSGAGVLYVVAHGTSRAAGPAVQLLSVAGTARHPRAVVRVNELTTVGSATALAQFTRGTVVRGQTPGLPNAAATALNLIDPGTGGFGRVVAARPNGRQTSTQATLATLADLLAGCTMRGPAACTLLFRAARPGGAPLPRTTLDAALDIARHPTNHVDALYALARSRYYGPRLAAAPTSWVLSLAYTHGGFNGPGRMAFDSGGNVWVTNNFQPPAPGTDPGLGLISLGPTGSPINGSPISGGGLTGVWWGIAVDRRNHIWTDNYTGDDPTPFTDPTFVGGHTVSEFTDRGIPLSGGGFTTGRLSGPQGIAVDQRGNIWIANHTGNSVTEYLRGNPAAARVFSGGSLVKPFAVAVDAHGNVWVDDNAITHGVAGQVTELSASGRQLRTVTGGGLSSPQGMAFDQAGNLWVANLGSNSITEIRAGRSVRRVPLRARSLVGPWSVAVDGNGNLWVASFLRGTLTEICGARTITCPPGVHTGQVISPAVSGFTDGGLEHLTAVQIDASGNAWVANNWRRIAPTIGGDGLVEFIGVAGPVRTPMIGPPQRP
jgi:sugar lactone lactonase YvrE